MHVIAADYYGKPEADLLHGWEPGAGSIYSHCFLKKVEVYDDYPTFWKVCFDRVRAKIVISRRAAAGRAELLAKRGCTLTGSKIWRNCGGSG